MEAALLKTVLYKNPTKPVMLMTAQGTLFTIVDAYSVFDNIIDINALDDVSSMKTIRANQLAEQLEVSEFGTNLERNKNVYGWLPTGNRHRIERVQSALGGKMIVLIMGKNPVVN